MGESDTDSDIENFDDADMPDESSEESEEEENEEEENEESEEEKGTASEAVTPFTGKYVRIPSMRKQRVLVLASRGITSRHRHLMKDLILMLPHSKKESKIDRKGDLGMIGEMCEAMNCTSTMFFEGRGKQDLFMWLSKVPDGPSIKFLVQNIHTMDEIKLVGNCLKGSRPILSFDAAFDSQLHWKTVKELFIQVFASPKAHPKTKPFIDHIFMFSIHDDRVWFRNYQITESLEDQAAGDAPKSRLNNMSLVEIGPRFCLNPVKLFDGSFQGKTLWKNANYVSPHLERMKIKAEQAHEQVHKLVSRRTTRAHRKEAIVPPTVSEQIWKPARM
eukprot:TRINITY_DN17651_c0_g1_i1.p1 TRINITY_DN17651_c0_g1~~TRINITY_DN17651_c0_g1_i1.p1  ORF type:complete len:366 (+),score=120.48 TRINITY_DN17651_c0_g1_i1:104-1099(+)